MNLVRSVLTAVDYSEPARAAFDYALALSRRNAAELTVVHAVPTDRRFEWDALKRIALVASLRQAAEAAGVPLKVSVQHGDPAGVILLHARSRRPDLIVLGTSERSAFDRVRLGSVAETVVLRASQPVLILPATRDGQAVASSLNDILVAVDFSAGSVAAVERALSMADGNSRVTLVHVVQGVNPETASRYMYRLMEPEYQRLLARDAWQRMPELMPANVSARVHARVVAGDPATEIARIGAEVDADLIVTGVTRRGAIGRRIFGSTAARVIRTAGRPVLSLPWLLDDKSAQTSANRSDIAA